MRRGEAFKRGPRSFNQVCKCACVCTYCCLCGGSCSAKNILSCEEFLHLRVVSTEAKFRGRLEASTCDGKG